jgi:hypothetical protein
MDFQDRDTCSALRFLLFCVKYGSSQIFPHPIDFDYGFGPVLNRDKVVDFHWDLCDPWTIASVSEDANTPGGGGTLQVLCIRPLFARPYII